MTSAPAVSAALRRIGYKPVGTSSYDREGIRVTKSNGDLVRVTVDLDSDTAAYRMAAQVADDLRAEGFVVIESQTAQNAMWVRR